MFNFIKNIVYSKYIKELFEDYDYRVFDDYVETVYKKDNMIFVEVCDKKIGKQLYEVLRWLKKNKITILTSTNYYKFKDYIYDKDNVVKWFCYETRRLGANWHWIEGNKKVEEFAYIVEFFEQNGFVLDDETFWSDNNCNSISELFSYFVPISEDEEQAKMDIEKSRACLLKYAHYMISKTRDFLSTDYDRIDKDIIINANYFGYNVCLVKMCYEYYKSGTVSADIFEVLKHDTISYNMFYEFVDIAYALKDDYASKYSITERTEKYVVYDGKIKIYNPNAFEEDYDESDYKVFLVNNAKNIKRNAYVCQEKLDRLIYNLDNDFIGIIASDGKEDGLNFKNISEMKFKNQAEIIIFVASLMEFSNTVVRYFSSKLKKAYQKECDLKSSIKCSINSQDSNTSENYGFRIQSIRELYNFTHTDVKKQILKILFDFLKEFLTVKYGEIHTEKAILEKIEVRTLNPLVAKAFIQYVLKNNNGATPLYEKSEVSDELYEMLLFYKKHESSNQADMFCFDSRFEYDPTKIPIVFGDEVEKKYQIKIEKGTKTVLSDGRCVEIFNRAINIGKLALKEEAARETLSGFFKNLEDEHVKVVGISELIYSRELNTANMYKLIGFIKEPIKGKRITDKYLCTLSNKDLYKIGGYLFSKFTEYYLPSTDIYVDEDFIFYIDILQKEFKVKQHKSHFNIYPDTVFERICSEKGYKREAFSDWNSVKELTLTLDGNIERYKNSIILRNKLLNIADSLDAYCTEHEMFYESIDNQCPICRKIKYLVEPDKIRNTSELLFEDGYAQHYKLNDELNLKLYKTSCFKFNMIEDNIVQIIDSAYDVSQDCFVPCKKAVDNNNTFVGYVYKAVQFEKSIENQELCINLKDSNNLALLPRLKSLKRLILQVKDLIKDKDAGFVKNPFTEVFLNPSHKKQVQILNIDFFSKGEYAIANGLADLTAKWTCQYVSKLLDSDKSLPISKTCKNVIRNYCETTRKLNAGACLEDLTTLLECITGLSEEMTKYCSTHKTYYSNKILFCPKCMPDTALQNYLTIKENKEIFLSKEPENEGGESFIYSYKDGLIAKVFKSEQINLSLKESTLCNILLKKDLLAELNKKSEKFHYVVPQKVLVDEKTGEIFGYVMENLQDVQPISNLKHKSIVEKLMFTQKDILEILITIGEGIETMHEKANIYIGDLNGQNILFDSKKNVYFIDFDGMGVDNIAPEFCTDGYIDPVSKESKNITMKDDWYSFAVQVFYYLTYTHPFNGIYYEIEPSGKKVMLDIPDKMKKRISLLGEHNLKPPAVAEPWDWMSPCLKNAFLEIFEGDLRESIVPILKNQYKTLCTNEVTRINPKFIAKKLHPFGDDVTQKSKIKVTHLFNQYAAICKDEKDKFIVVMPNETYTDKLTEKNNVTEKNMLLQTKIILADDEFVEDVKLTEDGAYAFIRCANKISVISLGSSKTDSMSIEDVSSETKFAVDENSIYYTGIHNNQPVLFQCTILPNAEVRKSIIAVGNKPVDWFNVKFGSKFVIVRRTKDGKDQVYCNNEKLCNIAYTDDSSEYNIVYDEATKLWLVINTEGNGIIIEPKGTYRGINLQKYRYNNNMLGVFFKKGKIYIPNNLLYIVDVFDESKVKQLQCLSFVNSESQILDVNNQGFYVKTENTLYEIRRG